MLTHNENKTKAQFFFNTQVYKGQVCSILKSRLQIFCSFKLDKNIIYLQPSNNLVKK